MAKDQTNKSERDSPQKDKYTGMRDFDFALT